MAKGPAKDRSLEEITQRIAHSRDHLGRDLNGLRYELDFPLKIRKSFQRQTVLWVSAAVLFGLMFAMGPVRKKKVNVDAKAKGKGKNTKEGVLGAGLMLSLAKIAGSVIKPMVVSYVTQKYKARRTAG